MRIFKRKTSPWTKDRLAIAIKKYGYDIGDYTYGEPKILWEHQNALLRIGKFCSFGENVTIYLGGNHNSRNITTYPFAILRRPWAIKKDNYNNVASTNGNVTIGADVWVADNVVILSGVTIGHGAVIGNGAIVSKSVPPYCVAVGNPANVVRKRFDDNIITQLLKIEWWHYNKTVITKLIPYLLKEDVEGFIKICQTEERPK